MCKIICLIFVTFILLFIGRPAVYAQFPFEADNGKIAPYQARFNRIRPVIAIIGENSGTELTDFAIPYGVLARSGAVELLTVSTQTGPLTMWPALRIQPHTTIQQFHALFPEGTDYLIVPAVVLSANPTLLVWVASQGAKGATVVRICDGALVLAKNGLLKKHRATGHWASEEQRRKDYRDTKWVKDIRYVAHGKIVSSAGISADIPTLLALVEAIAGRDKAAEGAKQSGVTERSARHGSNSFRPKFGSNLIAFSHIYTNAWFHSSESIGVLVAGGIDKIALALSADAYSRTGRSQAYALSTSDAPVLTQYELIALPDRVAGGTNPPKRILSAIGQTPSAQIFDKTLADMYSLLSDRSWRAGRTHDDSSRYRQADIQYRDRNG